MNDTHTNIAVFISGSGSNLQALIDSSASGELSGKIALVISNKAKAFGLERAKKADIETFVFKKKNYNTDVEANEDLLRKLQERNVDYIATAGYLQLLPAIVVQEYKNRIVNIHPALLPKFGGKGMYGKYVHQAVIDAGETESGPTVHLVDEIYDNGQILEQVKVPVLKTDSPDDLAARVLEQEHKIFAMALEKLIKGKYEINHG